MMDGEDAVKNVKEDAENTYNEEIFAMIQFASTISGGQLKKGKLKRQAPDPEKGGDPCRLVKTISASFS